MSSFNAVPKEIDLDLDKGIKAFLINFVYFLVPTTHEGVMPTTHEGVVPRTHEGAMPTTHESVTPKAFVKTIHEEDDDDDDNDK